MMFPFTKREGEIQIATLLYILLLTTSVKLFKFFKKLYRINLNGCKKGLRERNYFLQRGFIEEDFKYLRGYVGIEHQKQEEDFNIIFRCSDFSFIRRYVIPRSKKMRSVFASNKNGEYFYQTPITERHFLSKFGSKTYIINLTFKNMKEFDSFISQF